MTSIRISCKFVSLTFACGISVLASGIHFSFMFSYESGLFKLNVQKLWFSLMYAIIIEVLLSVVTEPTTLKYVAHILYNSTSRERLVFQGPWKKIM